MPRTLRRGDHGEDVRAFQRALNERRDPGWKPITVDGALGRATWNRAQRTLWVHGLPLHRGGITAYAQSALERARFNPTERRRAEARRGRRTPSKYLVAKAPAPKHGLVWLDGHQVAAWIAAYVVKVRKAGRWHGRIISGYRDPAYSRSLCMRMCGRPSCPGLCAGASSNHSGVEFPHGAIDVSDWATFGAECARLGIPLRNNLPRDRPHRSFSGV